MSSQQKNGTATVKNGESNMIKNPTDIRIPYGTEFHITNRLNGCLYRTINLQQIYLKNFSKEGEHPAAAYFFNVYPAGIWEAKANEFADHARIPEMEQLMAATIKAIAEALVEKEYILQWGSKPFISYMQPGGKWTHKKETAIRFSERKANYFLDYFKKCEASLPGLRKTKVK